MSATGVSRATLDRQTKQGFQNQLQQFKQFQQVFTQLGKDLKAGALAAAQVDYAALQTLVHWNHATSSSPSDNPMAQAFSQLSEDLQAGNLAAAQADYETIHQAFQDEPVAPAAEARNGDGDGAARITQLLTLTGQALQAGDVGSAQIAFAAMQQEFRQLAKDNNGTATFSVQFE